MRYLVNLDLSNNQLLNAVVQNLATAPGSPSAGQIYFDTTLDELRYYDGTQWITPNEYVHPTFTDTDYSSSGANVLSSIEITNGHIVSTANRVLTLADLGYTGATDANNYVHPTFSDPWTGITHPLTGVEVISDLTISAEGHVTDVTTRNLTAADLAAVIINDGVTAANTTWSSTKIQSEINNAVTGGMNYQGGYNASTNTPNLDSSPTAGTILQGYTYTVTTAGTFFTEDVQVGDVIIAEIDDPATLADFTIVNKNIPDIVSASETEQGIIELATQAEVNAGTDTVRAVTPATLATYVANQTYTLDDLTDVIITTPGSNQFLYFNGTNWVNGNVAASETVQGTVELATQAEVNAGTDTTRAVTPATLAGYISTLPVSTYTASVGNGAATSFALTHNLGTLDVMVQVYENSTGDTVIADTTRDTVNQVTVSFNVAPTTNQFRVIIKD
jgi:hypothetical protein